MKSATGKLTTCKLLSISTLLFSLLTYAQKMYLPNQALLTLLFQEMESKRRILGL
jgi:hypothetical protein